MLKQRAYVCYTDQQTHLAIMLSRWSSRLTIPPELHTGSYGHVCEYN